MDDVPNPYIHSNKAKELELKKDLQEAEAEYRRAVQAADSLPHQEYTRDFNTALDRMRNGVSQSNKHLPEDALPELISAYRELLALPFLTRTQLAGFYARHNALAEAKEIIEQALAIEADSMGHAGNHPEAERRAVELLRNITDILGPSNAEELFLLHFDKLDVNKNGFVDEAELKRAQLDLTVPPEAQSMIRYLLYHYFAVEKASNDEFGEEISGISKSDVRNFQKTAKSNWKRLKE
ncbi:MAG TPA: hypothetical protein EYN91_07680 [Candidatus Melainabacteria bacterium]|nr:hypothetical protein [Candidatus Melainabacteria bacterium]HIN64702.1 hypothetical protein [Candidatus Obscuribacterales bacterium]